jgi:ABC-2 type transport system permease protein
VTRLVAAELFKLRTTRTFYGLTLGPLVLVVLIFTAAALAGDFGGTAEPARDLLGIAGLSQVFALVLGLLSVTSEFRHGTVTPSLLTVPSRARLVLAKLAASALAGLVLGLVCFGVAAALVLVIFSARGIESGLDGGQTARIVVGGALAAALYAALGVGVGALVRVQVGAVIGALGWIFVLEPLIGIVPGVDDVVPKYGLNGVSTALSQTSGGGDLLGQVPGGLLLALYAAVAVGAGIAVLRRRDVSA